MFRKTDSIHFTFHLKPKTNLLTLRKCYLYLQYYKIDLSFSIKLQELNLNLCKEYKTEREARDEKVSAKQTYFLNFIAENIIKNCQNLNIQRNKSLKAVLVQLIWS